jgi:hypothetical protein
MSHSFKNHKLSDAERLWLREVYKAEVFDPKIAKVKLRDKLPKGFNLKEIDQRLLRDGKNLTIIGIWHADPNSVTLKHIETVILAIKDLIIKNPGIEVITAKQVSANTDLEESLVEIALWNMSGLGRFFSSASGSSAAKGYSKIELSGDDAYDEYLKFESLENLMEEYYKESPVSPTSAAYYITSEPYYTAHSGSTEIVYSYPSPETKKHEIKQDTAFVLMAMDPNIPELEDVYQTIKEVCVTYGIKAYRVDEIEHQDRITDLILSEIKSCEFLIADLSLERPNVYYEIGYAHALNKRPILFRKKETKLHFDLSVHNVPEYRNITELRGLLNKRLEAILGRSAG